MRTTLAGLRRMRADLRAAARLQATVAGLPGHRWQFYSTDDERLAACQDCNALVSSDIDEREVSVNGPARRPCSRMYGLAPRLVALL